MANWASRVHNWQQDQSNNIGITALRHDQEDNNIYLMLNRAWDTQASNGPVQDMDMNNFKFNNCAPASAGNEFATLSQLQGGDFAYATATGTSNNFSVVLSPAPITYASGMVVRFVSNQSINGASTLNVNGLGAISIETSPNINTSAGDILVNQLVTVVYDPTYNKFYIDSNLGGDLSQNGKAIYAADASSTDAYVISLSPALIQYTTGLMLNFYCNTGNTGGATLNVNALGAVTILKNKNQALETGDIIAGQLIQVIYDGTNFQLLSPSSALVTAPTVQSGSLIYAAAGGSTNAYTLTLSPAPASYVAGLNVLFKANAANTGSATLNVNGLGAITLKKNASTNLVSGDIVTDQIVEVVFDGTFFQISNPLSTGSGVTNIGTAGLATGGPITTTGTVTVTAALKADQISGTSTTLAVVPGVQQFHPSAAKAWVRFTTVTSTSITGSYNVTSLTDNGTGDTTINFTVSFSNANYNFSSMAPRLSSGGNTLINVPDTTAPTATSIRVNCRQSDILIDSSNQSVTFFGGQ